jgi:polyisoprenoid-binding protein YceI
VVLAGMATAGIAQPLPAGLFVLVPEESQIAFFVRDNRGGFSGRVREMEGRALVRQVREWTYEAEVQVRVSARSLTTGLGLRDSQMHRFYLHADRFPTLIFTGGVTAERVQVASDFAGEVRGSLHLHGVEGEVTFPVRITPLPNGFRGRGRFQVRMSAYGIPLPRFWIFVAEDPVQVTVDLVFRAPVPCRGCGFLLPGRTASGGAPGSRDP